MSHEGNGFHSPPDVPKATDAYDDAMRLEARVFSTDLDQWRRIIETLEVKTSDLKPLNSKISKGEILNGEILDEEASYTLPFNGKRYNGKALNGKTSDEETFDDLSLSPLELLRNALKNSRDAITQIEALKKQKRKKDIWAQENEGTYSLANSLAEVELRDAIDTMYGVQSWLSRQAREHKDHISNVEETWNELENIAKRISKLIKLKRSLAEHITTQQLAPEILSFSPSGTDKPNASPAKKRLRSLDFVKKYEVKYGEHPDNNFRRR